MARILLEMAMVVQTMKRIMAVLEASETNLWSAIHAINLAQRLGGKVFILRIFQEG